MRCEDIEGLLNEHADTGLTPAQRKDVEAHLAACEACSTAWHAARALRRHRALPTLLPSPDLIAKIAAIHQARGAKKRVSPRVAAIGGALAAGIALVAFDYYRTVVDIRVRPVPSVTMALNETRDVRVTIDSPEAFMNVEVRVLLAGGIELEGLRGRRELKWQTELEPGINRLTLPIVALDNSGGKILVAVGQGDKQRAFVVQVDVHGNAANTEI